MGSFVTVGAGVRLAGGVTVGDGAYLGAGALVREGCRIGPWSLVGMGAVVLDDVPPAEVWVGNPARRLRAVDLPAELRTRGPARPGRRPMRTPGPRVTVHVPAYNYGRFLGDALDSLLAQTCTDWEAIVIDDASTDHTPEVVARYEDPRLRFVRHDVNRGHIATFNEGIALARSDYFVILSADDRYRPAFLERALECFDAHPEVVLVFTDAELIDDHGHALGPASMTLDPDRDWVRDVSVELMFRPFIHGCAAVAPTESVRELGGYDPAFPHTADTYLWRRLAFRGPVGHVSGRLLQHREHARAMHLGTTLVELTTGEEVEQFSRLFRDPALPAAVAAQRSRLDAVLAVARARACFQRGRYGACAAEFGSAVRRDPRLWQADHPLWVFARDYARNHRPARVRE